jgi:SAM-dependent methyltransferase
MALERLDQTRCADPLQAVLHRNRYEFVLARLPAKSSVLEIGTGLGALTRQLFPLCARYLGVEYDPQACVEARRNAPGAEILEADARKLPFADNQFSFIVCLEVLEHLGDFRAGVSEIHRCLHPEGLAIVSVPYRRRGGPSKVNRYHLYEPGENELVTLFQSLFERVEVHYQFFEETAWMTWARHLRLRRLFGLHRIYADLTAGLPEATAKLRISAQPRGMKESLILVARGKKASP